MEQRLIDANKIEYEKIYVYPTGNSNYKECVGKSAKIREAETVLTIPENPTNGDMIKALFPNGVISYGRTRVYYSHYPNGTFDFRKDWWDAPYKSEVTKNETDN